MTTETVKHDFCIMYKVSKRGTATMWSQEAFSGEEALELFTKENPELIFISIEDFGECWI